MQLTILLQHARAQRKLARGGVKLYLIFYRPSVALLEPPFNPPLLNSFVVGDIPKAPRHGGEGGGVSEHSPRVRNETVSLAGLHNKHTHWKTKSAKT
jgi:hypothetical protein